MFIQLEEFKVNVVDGALEQTRRKTYLQIYKKPWLGPLSESDNNVYCRKKKEMYTSLYNTYYARCSIKRSNLFVIVFCIQIKFFVIDLST